MTTTTEAMNKAREALEFYANKDDWFFKNGEAKWQLSFNSEAIDGHGWEVAERALEALAALSSAEAQPVAIVGELCEQSRKEVIAKGIPVGAYLYAAPQSSQPIVLDCYDAGLLSNFGGGNVEWWQDYILAELGRAHEFYQSQVDTSSQPIGQPVATVYKDENGETDIRYSPGSFNEGITRLYAGQPVSGAVTDEQIWGIAVHHGQQKVYFRYPQCIEFRRDNLNAFARALLSAHQAPSEKAVRDAALKTAAELVLSKAGTLISFRRMADEILALQSTPAQAPVSVPEGFKLASDAIDERVERMLELAKPQAQQSEKDAQYVKRYRWLRSPERGMSGLSTVIRDDFQSPFFELKCGDELDEAIDAALASEQNKASGEKGGAK